MSWQASQWAANIPHGLVGYVAFRALTMLANDAKEDGSATWLAASTVAARLGVSERTAERAYEQLRGAALIRYGDQRHVAHLPENRRPKVYDLTMASHADLLEAQKSGPSELTAHLPAAPIPGPSKLTGPTAGVVSSKEEPPFNPSKTSQGEYRRDVDGPVDNSTADHLAPVLDGAERWLEECPGRWKDTGGHQLNSHGLCLHCSQPFHVGPDGGLRPGRPASTAKSRRGAA